MRLKSINNQSAWETKVSRRVPAVFLQSWSWGEFQKSVGHQPIRLAIVDAQNRWLGACQIFRLTLPMKLGHFFYLPRGPLWFDELSAEQRSQAWRLIIDQLNKSGAVFLRFEPLTAADLDMLTGFTVKQTKDYQPSVTAMLDLKLSAEELLANLHQKTRYNLRLAERKGIEVKIEPVSGDVLNTVFWPLLVETAKRDRFRSHSLNYYQKMAEALGQSGQLKILNAYYQGQCLVSYLLIYYGDTVTYLHGASSNKHRNLMATYLAQWRAMIDAKTQGYSWYDFWGIAPANMPNHPLAGVTRFKNNFGGQPHLYPGTFELTCKNIPHQLYRLLAKLR